MKKQTHCRLCKSEDMYKFLDLGFHPHSDQFRKDNTEPEVRYPLTVQNCRNCGLAQLGQVVDAHDLYTKDYLYEASITKTADKHWSDLVDDVIAKTGINNGVSVDIGGNDGTLALKFKEKGFEAWNVDPCSEVCEISESRGVITVNDFWGHSALPDADIITGTNVFAHVDDLDAFMEEVNVTLKKDGVFVFESPYFAEFLAGLEMDTVYHQHLSYLSLRPLVPFLEKYGFEVFDVAKTPLHGGGFRVFIARKGQRPVSPNVKEMLDSEIWTEEELMQWGQACEKYRDELFDLIHDLYKQGKTIACVSSPAKGMTMLNYTGIGRYISFITEKSKLKIGRYTPGTKILIESDDKLIERQPDYMLLLAWNFSKEIIDGLRKRGVKGKVIIPLPTIEIIEL
jgi:SAM-dependent methyltransferase